MTKKSTLTQLRPSINTAPVKTIAIALAMSFTSIVVPAHAASTSEMIKACVAEMDAQGVADASQYRTKLKRVSGASVKKLVIKLAATQDNVADKTLTCKVRRDRVISVITD